MYFQAFELDLFCKIIPLMFQLGISLLIQKKKSHPFEDPLIVAWLIYLFYILKILLE